MLALYSDRLFMAAVGVYVLAMVLHAAEFAAARSAKPALVGAGGPDGDGRPVEEARPRGERFARMAVSLTVLGALLHLGSIVTRGVAAERWPLGNMYEFTSAICLAAVVGWLVMLRRSPVTRAVGPFVLLPVVVLLFLAGTVLYAQAAPVVPALQSYWLVIHVTTITISSGLLLVPGVASILFLLRGSGRLPERLAERLPSSDVLDRLAYRTTIIAFPLFTFAVIAGAIWAEAAWGRFWGWDPKETVAFVSWVVYAAYLHARATAGWRAAGAAWINVAGFATVLFNLFFINMVVAGLHSYAGLG
ncbi:c-type cytochrome biogenesis protein CcsB [Pseudonocardia sp. KRD-184]|uniref:C-type cytochrome biogenesis protein CcsB n=1 Tax=Pseudonocardia oceani TaxID=2792013 RepID=A0ABS6U872_9PSEU|nr:c-type cytochrome biogenesis protein CcsB [Pseudonocardia oceani]MBW0092751.1 c-type cytochrome biogenesis protein CcsB [Pseudonocardia oceani]MBW0099576.1 c-type cytochrome biogenesis protein CcsB [Pseudonocardia oceani]MBW0112204.1 c-type cytochrome biogenesis protein CcsB [Pseudonocardia oceani]MBW0125546.1 c-type cytochrome biogenesis protein CcsB [Pseudonocardia oceani]MBW0128156.1 c-type cytochrome biogenesis protein CcsB [Pseudonocardia oceani]